MIHSTNDNQDTNEIGSIGFVIRNLGDGQPNRKFLETHRLSLGRITHIIYPWVIHPVYRI